MTDIRKPRRGSLAFRPRKRADSEVPSIGYWPKINETVPLDFAGYKCGMTSISMISQEPSTKGLDMTTSATVIEVPPMIVYGFRAYSKGNSFDFYTEDKKILELLNIKDKANSSFKENQEYNDVRLLAFTQPGKTKFGKKHIESMEMGIGGTIADKLKKAKELVGKELKISDVLQEGMFVDAISVTKGKGWQGPVKRFGIAKQRRKATGKVRHVGTLGPFHPSRVMYTVPMPGQNGYHKRTELNKLILKVGKIDEIDAINPISGFPHYGFVNNDFLLIKGSLPGASKRLVRLRRSLRKSGETAKVALTDISKAAKN